MTMSHARTAVCTIALLFAPLCATSHAAAMLAADQGGGYAGVILEKVAKTWQAPQYPSDHSVRVQVRIDANGEVLECAPVQSSNLALLDKSACAAVREIKKYPPPPYGMPIDVYLTFWTGLPAVGNFAAEPSALASAAQATHNEQQASAVTAAALALARAAEARAAAASKGATSPTATAQVSPGTSLSPRGTPPATPVTVATATSGKVTSGASAKGATAPKESAKELTKERAKSKSTKGDTIATRAKDPSEGPPVLIGKSSAEPKAPVATKASATAKESASPKAVLPAVKDNSPANKRGDTSTLSVATAAPVATNSSASDTSGGRVVSPAPVSTTAVSTAQPSGNLVGANAEEPTAVEGRYARTIRWTIREAMIIPSELPAGIYTFTIHVRLSATGQITKADMTHSSGEALMDKYAIRGIKRVQALPPPPTQKLHDLHLTFVVQRS